MSTGFPGRRSLRRLLLGDTARRYGPLASVMLMLPLLAVLLLVFYLPIVRLLLRSLFDPDATLRHYARLISQPLYLAVLARTLRTALIVSVASLLLGYPVAYLMARVRDRVAAALAVLIILPLWTSVLVRSFAWTVLLQRNGVVNTVLQAVGVTREPLRLLYTEGAVWIAMTHILLPLMILPIYGTLRGVPADLAVAAASMGARPSVVLRHIILPLSLPGVAAGTVMVFTLALGFFITPAILGGPRSLMLSTLISQQATTLLDWPFAGALSMLLLAVTLLIVVTFRRVLRLDRFTGDGA